MKVKDLDFIMPSELAKLRDVADLDLEAFVEKVKDMEIRGARIPVHYQRIFDMIISLGLVHKPKEEITDDYEYDELRRLYDDIPISELKYHFPQHEKYIFQLKNNGINTLGQLYILSQESIMQLPGIGTRATMEIATLRQFLRDNQQLIIDSWQEAQKIYELPSNFDINLGFVTNLHNAILELIEIMEKRLCSHRYVDTSQRRSTQDFRIKILKMFYQEGNSDLEIATILGKTQTHVAKNRHDIVTPFYYGERIDESVFYNNIYLRSGLVELIKSLNDECVFRERTKLVNYFGKDDETFFTDLGYDSVEVLGIPFVIPKDTKGIYNQVGKDVVTALREKVIPCSPDEIVSLIEDDTKSSKFNFDTDFVYNILSCSNIVDVLDDGSIQIQYKHLSRVDQKYARIIYEADKNLTKVAILKEFERRDGFIPSATPSNLKKYGIYCEGNNWYYGEPRIPIQQKVSSFAEEKKIFFYNELESFLISEGYTIPPNIRNNITKACVVDNKDSNHFCHKEFVEDYPEFSWRNTTKYGLTNWILNEIKSILEEGKKLSLEEMTVELGLRSVDTEYGYVVPLRAKYILESYCGNDKLFLIEDGCIVKNIPVFENTEFAYIGLREGMYQYYPQIRSIAANEVKKNEQGKLSLEAFRVIVNEILDKEIGRNVIIRAIEDKHKRFSPIDVILATDKDGKLYIQWTKQESTPEPVYEVIASEEDQENETIKEVTASEQKPAIRFRQVVNWNELSEMLKTELSFYKYWMIKEGYHLDSSIDMFIEFLQNAENSNLSKKLPQNLYEYWFASTDRDDRSTYLGNLAIFFEAFLAEIHYQMNGEKIHKKGLSDWAEEFPGLPQMLLFSKDNKGFDRIASDLHYRRNKIAHGEDMRINTMETAKIITDYVALYVYVLARYYHK